MHLAGRMNLNHRVRSLCMLASSSKNQLLGISSFSSLGGGRIAEHREHTDAKTTRLEPWTTTSREAVRVGCRTSILPLRGVVDVVLVAVLIVGVPLLVVAVVKQPRGGVVVEARLRVVVVPACPQAPRSPQHQPLVSAKIPHRIGKNSTKLYPTHADLPRSTRLSRRRGGRGERTVPIAKTCEMVLLCMLEGRSCCGSGCAGWSDSSH